MGTTGAVQRMQTAAVTMLGPEPSVLDGTAAATGV